MKTYMYLGEVMSSNRMLMEKGMFWATAPICVSSSMASMILFKNINVKKSYCRLAAGKSGACQNFVILPAVINN